MITITTVDLWCILRNTPRDVAKSQSAVYSTSKERKTKLYRCG